MDVLLEEKRYQEGKELSCELIRHGVSNSTIKNILGADHKTVWEWRKKTLENGWDGTLEAYENPEELESKLQKLSEYAGLYTRDAFTARWEQKKKLFKIMLSQGIEMKQIAEILGVTEYTLRKWRKGGSKEYESEVWKAEWCQNWDAFMSSLARPIRLEGK